MTNTNRQALIAAFTFGLVVYAGTSAVSLLLSNRASKIIRDAPRLALIVFLISSALWAQMEFSAFLLNINSKPGCQIMITFASTFDQFSRVSMQQSLLWILSMHNLASLTEISVTQGFLLLRLILGGVFVGIQRPQLDTVCLTQTSILPVGIAVSVVDTAFVAFLLMRVISRGAYKDTQKGVISSSQSRAIALVVLGLIIWTGTSAPLMLSIRPMQIVVRTTVPSIGLLILIDRLFCDDSKLTKPTDVPDFDASRDLRPRHMSTADIYKSSRPNEFTREARDGLPRTFYPLPTPAEPKRELPVIARPAVGQADIGMGGVPVLGQLFPLPRTKTLSVPTGTNSLANERLQRPILKTTTPITLSLGPGSSVKSGTLGPVISAEDGDTKPGDGEASIASRSAGTARLVNAQHGSLSSEPTLATTTSAFLSPGIEEVRRRSPRQLPSPALSLFPRLTPTRLQARPSPKTTGDTIVNFSLPVDAQASRPQHQTRLTPPKSAPLARLPRDNANEILRKREDAARTLSVVHRPRPIPRKSNVDRAIFPAEGSPNLQHHKRSLSCGSIRFKQALNVQSDVDAYYDLSLLKELTNGTAEQASVPTPSLTSHNTRRRSQSMSGLPLLPSNFEPKPTPTETTPRINQAYVLATMPRTPASSGVPEYPISPVPTITLHEESISATRFGRRSSPILPVEDLNALSPSTIRDEDFAIDSALRSPATQVHVQRALTVIVAAKSHQRNGLGVAETPLTSRNESRQGPLPLAVHKPSVKANVGFESELERAEDSQSSAKQHLWPSQVGETRPTFSDRGHIINQRRSLPPAPLVIRRTDKVHAEPSPVESEDGLVEIAKKMGKGFGSPSPSYQIADSDQLALLTNLELELTEQEHQWHAIRRTMVGRDSLSTVGTSPSRDSRYESARQSFIGARLAQRQQLDADYDLLALLPQTDLKSKAKLVASSTFPRFPTFLEGHTPPDTDEESEYGEDHDNVIGQAQGSPAKTAMALWRPIASVAAAGTSTALSLWTPASRPWKAAKEIAPEEISGVSIRRPVRKDQAPLVIESSRLWEKPESEAKSQNHGLWQPVSHSQLKTQVVEVKVQHLTPTPRKPPRRIKRVTLLPDILESPKPLPDRRGTLGIFQFPWGDRSDCATVTARSLAPRAMSGTIVETGVDGGMQSNRSEFDMEDYEQDDEDYYDSSETYDSDDEDCFERVQLVAQSTPTPTDKRLHATPPRKILASHADEIDPRPDLKTDRDVLKQPDSEDASPKVGCPAKSKSFLLCEEEQENGDVQDMHMHMHDSGNGNGSGSHDKAKDRTCVRSHSRGSPQAGDYNTKADVPTSTMTLTDLDLREYVAGKTRIRVCQDQVQGLLRARQPQIGGQVASISSIPMSVPQMEPQMAHCLLMNMGQTLAGAPINCDNDAHGTSYASPVASKSNSDPCTDKVCQSRGAPSVGHPQALLLFCFLEGSISKLAHQDYCPPSPLPLIPLVIYKSETPTRRQQILVINLLYSPSTPSSSFQQQTTTVTITEHTKTSMALWTPSTPVTRPNRGLPQPDNSTWNAYLPTGEAARLLPAKADMPTIKSNSLWTAPAKKAELTNFGLWGTKQPLPGMWTHSPIHKKTSYGLPQPDAETWATYLIVEDDASRVKPREAEPAIVDSNSLWTAPESVISETPSEDGLWSGSSSAPSVNSSEPSTPREAVNFGLWEALPAIASVNDEEPVGLFSLNHRRTDYRTTKLMPAAHDMERAPRRPLDAFPDFGFTHLWNMAPLWDSKANAAAVKLQGEIDSLVLEGLFSLNHRRNNFRTTSETPAALETRPKQRISQQSLPKLDSDSLWSVRAPSQDVAELDWITLSTVRPRATSVVSLTDSESSATVPALTRASSISSDKARPVATADEWLAALGEAIKLGSGKDVDTLDMAAEDPCTPDSDNYQLWSKPTDDDETLIASDELWTPSIAGSAARFLELTPTLSEFDKIHSESGTSQRGRTQKSRPPLPMYPGSTSSAFLPGASETPRDFSAQALWVRAQSPAPGAREDGSWLDKSLRKGLSFMQLR
ncbi:hypothetical protein FSARC_999 [Fusarium sarcochroum]|uniref:Uncharacterized protein n=1 Tax=Fusarium sarcochroum TaxID=1208366 RepID=A0A8H4UAD9_9HYPO|nr:hypothetical protein FSARC_999 [Fusarium sarcochroum]